MSEANCSQTPDREAVSEALDDVRRGLDKLDTALCTIEACKRKQITDDMTDVSALTNMLEDGMEDSLNGALTALSELRELLKS